VAAVGEPSRVGGARDSHAVHAAEG
jgi:hypothetical protein